MFKRLLVKTPLYLLFYAGFFTVVLPITYWIITGKSYIDLMNLIDEI